MSDSEVPLSHQNGVLLVGHGTRDVAGTEQFFELGRQLQALLPQVPTESALLEFQHPTIPEAWESLTKRGVRHVHVAPLLLFAAGHAKQDIPDEIERCRESSDGVSVDQTRPLSRHPDVVALVVQRIRDALESLPVPPEQTAVVMVGRGNRDPCAQADMRVLTEVVHRQVPCGLMSTAFYAMANPRLPEVLDSIAATNRWQQIVVYPHLLFHGRLLEAIHRQVDEASERHPSLAFSTAQHLGPHPLIARAICGRIEQAATEATAAQCR